MRAVACTNGELDVVERPQPTPGEGQVRIRVLRCGICGSDLHARHGTDAWAKIADRMGYDRFARSTEAIVFGHEFCGEVLEHGSGCRRSVPSGTTLSPKQVQGWLRHSQLTTTMNVYIHEVDDGLGSADAWDDILGAARGNRGATQHPETAANGGESEAADSASQSQISEQPQTAANA